MPELRRVLGALLLLAVAAAADGADDDLDRRVGDLERENEALRERVDRLESERDELLAGDIRSYLEEEGLGLNLVVRRGSVHGTFQLFGDTGLVYENPERPNRGHAFFFNGGFDFFFTARVGDHFRVLTETVFLTSVGTDDDSSKFDQERLWASWSFSDRITIKFGLEHGPISRWNALYHHGRWLELTVTRPFVARFEADNGILPMHEAGVELSGRLLLRAVRVRYLVYVANGRGPVANDVQEFSDRNDAKAVTLGLGVEPTGRPLFVGLFVRIDDIPADPDDPARSASIREVITSFQVDYRGERVQILAELAWLQDRDRASDVNFEALAGYVQVGYGLDDEWTPYLRVDFREMDRGNPFLAPLDRDLDILELLVGVRFDFVENAALKLEIGLGEREERDDGGAVRERGYIRVGVQLAFVF